jgi:hypothetical protein
VHEIIALQQRIAARRARRTPAAFSLARIDARRFASVDKGPDKLEELRGSRPLLRREARLRAVAERVTFVDKIGRRVMRVGKVRLFRLWKMFGKAEAPVAADVEPRPLGERLAWLRVTRRL